MKQNFIKNLLNKDITISFIVRIIIFYSFIVRITSKINVIGKENIDKILSDKKTIIFSMWHGRIFVMPHNIRKLCPDEKISTMASPHRDGLFIAKMVAYYGSEIIYGSTNQEPLKALKEAIKTLKSGKHLCIIPDGPRGPRMKVNGAIVNLAKMTDSIIIPAIFSSSRHKIFNSWDRFMIPLPFSKITIIYGEGITAKKDDNPDNIIKIEKMLEDTMNNLLWDIDDKYNIKKIEQGDSGKGKRW